MSDMDEVAGREILGWLYRLRDTGRRWRITSEGEHEPFLCEIMAEGSEHVEIVARGGGMLTAIKEALELFEVSDVEIPR